MSTSKTTAPFTPIRWGRILLTGAAGNLGRVLRPRMKAYCETLRLTDISAMAAAGEGEEVHQLDLADKAGVDALLEGVDVLLHFGGISVERSFEEILPANIVGTYNVYEAARKHGIRRVVLASSNHVTGFYTQGQTITPQDPPRPDGYYGLSKAFAENLAQFYFDRYRIETVSVRIGSSWPEPVDRRMLASWLSYDDLERLIVAALTAPIVDHTIIFGMSDNRHVWWDNASARHIGFKPEDNSNHFRAAVEARQPRIDVSAPELRYQGGGFVVLGPFEDTKQP